MTTAGERLAQHQERRARLQALVTRLGQETVASVALLADDSGQPVAHWCRLGEVDIAGIAALTAGSTQARQALSVQIGANPQQSTIVQEYDNQTVVILRVDARLTLLVVIEELGRLGVTRLALKRAAAQVAELQRA